MPNGNCGLSLEELTIVLKLVRLEGSSLNPAERLLLRSAIAKLKDLVTAAQLATTASQPVLPTVMQDSPAKRAVRAARKDRS